MADGKYSGEIDFDGWNPVVRNMQEAGEEIQATFIHGDPALFTPTSDGLSICCMLQCLGGRTPPEFTVPLSEIGNWAIFDDENDWAPFVAELRRVADVVESAMEARV